jgi:hypothetical protein
MHRWLKRKGAKALAIPMFEPPRHTHASLRLIICGPGEGGEDARSAGQKGLSVPFISPTVLTLHPA